MDQIEFGEGKTNLDELNSVYWEHGETKLVNFYENKPILVQLLSTEEPNLAEKLESLVDGKKISVDFEWKPDRKNEKHMISLFQFCSSKGVILVHREKEGKLDGLNNFMSKNKFFGKGMGVDKRKLNAMFNTSFNIEDIQETWLKPYNVSINFVEMIKTLAGEPTAQFKDASMSTSDWTVNPLTVKQVLYAAFDAYGLYLCYDKLVEQYKVPGHVVQIKKKGREKKVKKEPVVVSVKKSTQRSYHIRFDTDVPFRGSEIFPPAMKEGGEVYHPGKSFRPRDTLVSFMRSEKMIKDNFCCICNKEFDDITLHCWMNHHKYTSRLYFPLQTEKFLERVEKEIELGNKTQTPYIDGLKCLICGKVSGSVHAAYTHARMDHPEYIQKTVNVDAKMLSYGYLINSRTITEDPLYCNECKLAFNTKEELIDHCWEKHGDVIPTMWKHRPICYLDKTYDEAFDLGVKVVNELIYGPIIRGVISCWDCHIGFDSPCELFIHLFHKHTTVRVLFKADIPPNFSFIVKNLPEEIKEIIRKHCQQNAEAEMVLANIYDCIDDDNKQYKCNECGVVLHNSDESWEHMIRNHLVVLFEKGKPYCNEDE